MPRRTVEFAVRVRPCPLLPESIMSLTRVLCAVLATALMLASPAAAQAPEKEPGPRATGKRYSWTASNGIAYEYFVPKSYEAEEGANLTFILHGSNMDRRWGFANHKAGEFRPDDIVVSPDGTTTNNNGGFNSLQRKQDLERFHELHQELREIFQIRATYLYGHSQGSFFSFYYAGAYPEEVQGVVGQASGVWIGTPGGKKHHHQAIVLLHGTAAPVVSYGNSAGSLSAHFRKLEYPLARLRSLEGWNHWPSQHHASQQLAWCEGMTTSDPERIAVSLEALVKPKENVDPVAAYQLATRVLTIEGLDSRTRKEAEKALREVNKVADAHAAVIAKSIGKNRKLALEDEAWVGHGPLFLRHFRGMPQGDALSDEWSKTLEAHSKDTSKLWKEYREARESDPKQALLAGIELVQGSFLTRSTAGSKFLDQLAAWADNAKTLRLKKSEKKTFEASVPVFRSALEKGRKSFDKVSRRFR